MYEGDILGYFLGVALFFSIISFFNKKDYFGLARISQEAEKNYVALDDDEVSIVRKLGRSLSMSMDSTSSEPNSHSPAKKQESKFAKSLLQRSKFYGIGAESQPDWMTFANRFVPFLATGADTDFWFYIFNHHSLLSMGFGSSSNKFSRLKKRCQFLGVQGATFIMFVAATLITRSSVAGGYSFQYLFVLPMTFLLTEGLYGLIVCPCVQNANSDTCLYSCSCARVWCLRMCYKKTGFFIGVLISLFLFVVCLLFAAEMMGADANGASMLGEYIYEMHLVSSVTELIQIWLIFLPMDEDPQYLIKLLNKYLRYGEWSNERRRRDLILAKEGGGAGCKDEDVELGMHNPIQTNAANAAAAPVTPPALTTSTNGVAATLLNSDLVRDQHSPVQGEAAVSEPPPDRDQTGDQQPTSQRKSPSPAPDPTSRAAPIIELRVTITKSEYGIGLDITKTPTGGATVVKFKDLPPGAVNPAESASPAICPGDIITEVNGVACLTLKECVKGIRSSADVVTLTLQRNPGGNP